MRGRRRVGVPSGRLSNGRRGDPPHKSVHQEAADKHIREGSLLPRLCTVHGGGADSRDDQDIVLVGSRRSKQTGGIDREEV